jgi:hypothetical protein
MPGQKYINFLKGICEKIYANPLIQNLDEKLVINNLPEREQDEYKINRRVVFRSKGPSDRKDIALITMTDLFLHAASKTCPIEKILAVLPKVPDVEKTMRNLQIVNADFLSLLYEYD